MLTDRRATQASVGQLMKEVQSLTEAVTTGIIFLC